jgi:hypothetical protein
VHRKLFISRRRSLLPQAPMSRRNSYLRYLRTSCRWCSLRAFCRAAPGHCLSTAPHRLRSLISRPHDYSPTSRHVPQPCIFISSYDLCSSSAIRIIASTVYARGARSSHHIAFWITSRHVVLARLARAAVAETAHWKRQNDYHIRP